MSFFKALFMCPAGPLLTSQTTETSASELVAVLEEKGLDKNYKLASEFGSFTTRILYQFPEAQRLHLSKALKNQSMAMTSGLGHRCGGKIPDTRSVGSLCSLLYPATGNISH